MDDGHLPRTATSHAARSSGAFGGNLSLTTHDSVLLQYQINARLEPWREPDPWARQVPSGHACQNGGARGCKGACGGAGKAGGQASAAPAGAGSSTAIEVPRSAAEVRAEALAEIRANAVAVFAKMERIGVSGDSKIHTPRVPPTGEDTSFWKKIVFDLRYAKFLGASCEQLLNTFRSTREFLFKEFVALQSRECATLVQLTSDEAWLAIGKKCNLGCATPWACQQMFAAKCGCPVDGYACMGQCIGTKAWNAWYDNGNVNFEQSDADCPTFWWVTETKNFFKSRVCNKIVLDGIFTAGDDAFVKPAGTLGLTKSGAVGGSLYEEVYWQHRQALAWALLKKCPWTSQLYSCAGKGFDKYLAPIPKAEYPEIFCAGMCAPLFPVPPAKAGCNCWALNEISAGKKAWFDLALNLC